MKRSLLLLLAVASTVAAQPMTRRATNLSALLAYPVYFQFFGPGTTVFHIDAMSPAPTENSTIFDFDGAIGAAIVDGTGTATNTKTGVTQSLNFDTDMRFMQGVYIGLDGEKHRGTFSLI